MIKRYNISKPRKYTDRNGDEKTQWSLVGTLTEFIKDDGTVSRLIEIPAINLTANAFEQKAPESPTTDAEPPVAIDVATGAKVRTATPKQAYHTPAVAPRGTQKVSNDQIEYPTEDINPDDIPF